jgi:hypothetical protein
VVLLSLSTFYLCGPARGRSKPDSERIDSLHGLFHGISPSSEECRLTSLSAISVGSKPNREDSRDNGPGVYSSESAKVLASTEEIENGQKKTTGREKICGLGGWEFPGPK